jgi:hypothetical protein
MTSTSNFTKKNGKWSSIIGQNNLVSDQLKKRGQGALRLVLSQVPTNPPRAPGIQEHEPFVLAQRVSDQSFRERNQEKQSTAEATPSEPVHSTAHHPKPTLSHTLILMSTTKLRLRSKTIELHAKLSFSQSIRRIKCE